MDRSTVEKRDQEVVEKFRAVVDAKTRGKKIAWLRVFAVILVLGGAGVFFFRQMISPPALESVRYASRPVAITRSPAPEAASSPAEPAATAIGRPTGAGKAMPIEQKPSPAASPEAGGLSEEAEILYPDPDLKAFEGTAAADPDHLLLPRPGLARKSSSPDPEISLSPHPHIRIAEMAVCRDVADRKPVSRQNVFALGKGERPHVWMDVRATRTPQTLRHVYYHNGKRHAAVNLDIRYPRTRTWSNVTLKHPHETGRWRVDVVAGKGEVIARTEFTVIY